MFKRILLVFFSILATVVAADWPMYRYNAGRTSAAPVAPALPLHVQWRHIQVQPPAPSWPEPVKTLNRLDFDYAPHPVIAGNLLCYGSSADDTVYALNAENGELLWSYITGGPVRFPPQLVGNKVYFAADDGFVYCLDQAQGWLLWRFAAAPAAERFIGNGRMISRWPVRTGVLVHDNRVYFAAGMWPSEGVFVYCLDAVTGEMIWVNDTSHALAQASAHGGEYGMLGVAPQGALLLEGDSLLVPTGRNMPAVYDLNTGALRYYETGNVVNSRGGSWCGRRT